VRAQKSYASDGGPDPPKQTDTLEERHNGTCSSPDTQSDSQEGSDAACSPPLPWPLAIMIIITAFSALTLLAGRQEEHPAYKN